MTHSLSTYAYLSRVLIVTANTAAMGAAYKTWTDEYCRKGLEDVWLDRRRPEDGRKVTVAEISELPIFDKRSLGMAAWDDGLWLIPLWMFNYIADGEEFVSIDGERVVKGVDHIDFDTRSGLIAYGFEGQTQ